MRGVLCGVNHGAHAHEAGFDRDAEDRSGQPVIARRSRGVTDRDDLGVGGRIAGADRVVESAPDDVVADRHDGPDGHLAGLSRASRLVEGGRHPQVK